MVTYLEKKREEYKNIVRINPNAIDSVQGFQTAIDAINMAIFLILNPTDKFSRMAAIEPAQKKFVEELESLKKELQEHPNHTKALENANARKLAEELKSQEGGIKSDEQFMAWLTTTIPSGIEIKNKDIFLHNIVRKIFVTKNFDEADWKYGQYERDKYSGNVLAILDLRKFLGGYVVIVKSPFGYTETNLQLYKMPTIYTERKEQIIPSVILDEEYLLSKKR